MAEWNGEYISPYAEHGKKKVSKLKNYSLYPIKSAENFNWWAHS